MSLNPPKRLFHVPSMSTVMYVDIADDVKKKGYVAISHVWGNQQMYSADELGINGVEWGIPLSDAHKISRLVDAMNQFEKEEYCWFDVLCMPQNRQDEINEEIPFMGDYYAGAKATFVLSDVNYNKSEDYWKWVEFMLDIKKSNRNFTKSEINWMMYDTNGVIMDLSKDQWFTRVWTFQEAVLSNYIILFGANGIHHCLDDIIMGVNISAVRCPPIVKYIVGESYLNITKFSSAVTRFRKNGINLAAAISVTSDRNCHKIQDRFYGLLGVLGYRDFVVEYNTNVEDLNREMIIRGHSEGDLTWLSATGDYGNGFIQPMYDTFSFIGGIWKGDYVTIYKKHILLNAVTFIKIYSQEKYFLPNEPYLASRKYIICKFKEWGFSYDDIAYVMVGYCGKSIIERNIVKTYIHLISEGITSEEIILHKIMKLFRDKDTTEIYNVMLFWFSRMFDNFERDITIVGGTILETGKNVPIIVFGNANIGDRILLLKLYDELDRNLGIVFDGIRRKGICLYEKMEIPEHMYEQHKFKM